MKKLFVLLTAVLFLFSIAASAETMTAETVLFTSEKANYSMMIPADFIPAGNAYVEIIKNKVAEGKLPGVDDQRIAQIQNIAANADLSQFDFILNGTLNGNINIQAQYYGIPGSLLPLYKDQLDEVNIEAYADIGVSRKNITTYDMEEIGHYNWYRLSCSLLGVDVDQYITVDESGMGYILTFTGIDEADMELMLSTFQYE